MTPSPLNLFLSRELRNNKLFNSRSVDPRLPIGSWTIQMASAMSRPGELMEVLQVAKALPLPVSAKDRQQALELAAFVLPSRALWRKRPVPQEPVTPEHEAYWAACDDFLSTLQNQPGLDPVAPVSSRELLARVDLRKMPLGVALMHLGHPKLLDRCAPSLPQSHRPEAVQASAIFNRVDLCEALLAHWDPTDTHGLTRAQEGVWGLLSLERVGSDLPLPAADPPQRWWSRLVFKGAQSAFDRVAAARPRLAWHIPNARLMGDMNALLRLRVDGGLNLRESWVAPDGSHLPAIGMVVCAYVREHHGKVVEPRCAQDLRDRLNLLRDTLPAAQTQQPAHAQWDTLARWIYAAGQGNSERWKPVPPVQMSAPEQVSHCAEPWLDAALNGPSSLVLRPLAIAAFAAAREHANGDPERIVEAYQATTLPWLRRLAARQGAGVPSDETRWEALHDVVATLTSVPGKLDIPPLAAKHEMLEALLWRAAFQRLKDRGASRSFPKSMGAARGTWDQVRALLAAGARPAWSQSEAGLLLDLVGNDPRLPEEIHAFIQAEALRDERAFAPGRPRRI